jgi:disulfide bond formation protein DsbB
VDFNKPGRPATDPLNPTGVDMPPRGGNPALTDDDLVDIVAFLRSIHE